MPAPESNHAEPRDRLERKPTTSQTREAEKPVHVAVWPLERAVYMVGGTEYSGVAYEIPSGV